MKVPSHTSNRSTKRSNLIRERPVTNRRDLIRPDFWGAGIQFATPQRFACSARELFRTPTTIRTTASPATPACLSFGCKLERLQVLDESELFLFGQLQLGKAVVVLDNIPESRKASIMIEAALLMTPKPREWRGAVHACR